MRSEERMFFLSSRYELVWYNRKHTIRTSGKVEERIGPQFSSASHFLYGCDERKLLSSSAFAAYDTTRGYNANPGVGGLFRYEAV